MNQSLLAVLNDNERLLVAETEPSQLAGLDEDAAIALETRVRRTRNKYTSQFRRAASARVAEQGGRGRARPTNRRAAMKAEAFEEALSRVSRLVSVLSRRASTELRRERIAAARGKSRNTGPQSRRPVSSRRGQISLPAQRQVDDRSFRTPATEKRRASTMASGARRQASRDAR